MTPLEKYPELAKAIGVKTLFFKREDMHPYGSHKGRSIPIMIDHYYQAGDRSFAITGSGNAALAAVLHVKKLNEKNASKTENLIALDIFVGTHISEKKIDKIKKLADDRIRILTKERPLQALTQAIQDGARSLRQSTDDMALVGYETLAEELSEVKELGAIFIGTSSGTTAQALAEYFSAKKMQVQIHIVQTSSCHPMFDAFDSVSIPEERSIADAIVDQTAQRKSALIPLIESSGGNAWLAANEDIETALNLVKENTGLDISTNSALSVVGAMKSAYEGYETDGAVVCMICGD